MLILASVRSTQCFASDDCRADLRFGERGAVRRERCISREAEARVFDGLRRAGERPMAFATSVGGGERTNSIHLRFSPARKKYIAGFERHTRNAMIRSAELISWSGWSAE
jgi:hypothetical protein